ncbi:unnamed protein product [Arctia plantaginis]|uniref:Uncharacterized protein n=1 Tax=Arctia plantaginis TaxID=874455 RepID=A0A8S0ZZ16_ARCPL|nr:unnamed protein product [Arctia plantaginis]
MIYHKPDLKDVIYKLGIGLKTVYNDLEVEELMIKRSKFFSSALIVNCMSSLILMTFQAFMSTIRTGEPFTTVITVIPDIKDDSTFSNVLRGIYNIFWLIYVTRLFSVFTLVICLTTAMSHQFINLNSYFCSLNNIFTEDNFGTHKEREEKYEKSLKIGIELHSESLKCTNQIQNICREVFSGQIIFNIILLVVLMYQMVSSDRTLTNTITLLVIAANVLLSTGFFVYNAGDITLEAEKLITSVYFSGWENCYGDCSKRVRKLIVIAMMQAQQPVVFSGLGVIPLSYQSYVSIVKSSYSVFSVLY